MTSRPPHHIVIAGGGVAGLEAMLALCDDLAPSEARVTLLSPDDEFVYRALSTGEPFGRTSATRYSIGRLTSEHGVTWEKDAIVSADPAHHTIATAQGKDHAYDSLIVALGAERHAALENVLTFTDQSSVPGFRDLLERLRSGRSHSVAFLVPRGSVWPFPLYELALMTAELVRDEALDVKVMLITPASAPLALFGKPAAEAMTEMLAERSIQVIQGNATRATAPGRVLIEPDEYVLAADELVALPQLSGPWIRGLPHTHDRFIPTDPHGRVEGLDDVYAAGDCTVGPIKQGGLAAQQADTVVADIVARLRGHEPPEPAPPVLRGVLLTGTGRSYLRANDFADPDAVVSGQALWWPPSKIAGRYLAPCLGFTDEREQLELHAVEAGVEVQISVPPGSEQLHDLAPEAV
ncbi:MAG: sulfide:quinone oxidoreductase [Solirubrobacteraceae bacterium]|nr:sulfide:quinone oxidoreductase [Solirubrobacteraceae bacterium]